MFLVYTSAWGQLQWGQYNPQLDGHVTTVYTDITNDKLYLGGDIGHVNGQVTPGIVEYDGTGWSPVGVGINSAVNTVYAIAVYHDTIFIGGLYSLGGLKKWTGTEWVDVGGVPILSAVYDLEVIDDELWVAGTFDSVGSLPAHGLARWDGAEWKTAYDFPWGINGPNNPNWVVEITEYKGEIYVSGNLDPETDTLGDLYEIARWNGQEWTDVGGGIKQDGFSGVSRMVEYKGDLYVMGTFSTATGNADNNIMRWNGEEWLRCGGGTESRVYDAVVYQDKLWVTGSFDDAGGVPTEGLAVWDGEQWCSSGNAFRLSDTIQGWPAGIGVYRDTLVMGGSFTSIDGIDYSYLAYWIGEGNFDSCGVEWPVGVEERKASQPITLFPNPVNDVLTVQVSDDFVGSQVSVMSMDGRMVWNAEQMRSSGFLNIPTSGLAQGVYVLCVKSNGERHTAKFVKR